MKISARIINFLRREASISYGLILGVIVLALIYFFAIGNNKTFYKPDGRRCDTCGIGITDLVRQVKSELRALEDSMVENNEDAVFQLKNFELEINFVVRENTSSRIQGGYELISVEGSKEYSNERVQKLKLYWQTVPPTPDSVEISSAPLDSGFLDSLKKISK